MPTYELTRDGIQGLNTEIAVLPVASLEQHGPHLPVNTDIIIAEAYAEELSRELNAFQLPCIPISTCREHMGYKGSVWINPDTFYRVIKDICLSLKEQGFKKVVLLQGHGGIFVAVPAIRELNATLNPELQVCRIDPGNYLEQFRKAGIISSQVCLHADEFETSLVMHLRKELVQADLIKDCIPEVPREYLNYGSIYCATPTGVWGQPSLASAEKGGKLLACGSRLMAEDARRIFNYMDKKVPQGYSRF